MTKQRLKEIYCENFERALIREYPLWSGKIHWDAVLHFHYTNVCISEAVNKYISSYGEKP